MQLHKYDIKEASANFKKNIIKKSLYGFCRFFGMSSDDSEHHNVAMHVFICASIANDGPSFCHLSCSPFRGKDAEGNAQNNFKVVNETFDNEVLGHIIGGTTNNADSAKVKNKLFFNKVKEHLLATNNSKLESLTVLNGVNLRHIFLGDLFHVDNLIVTHASKAAFGDMENASHQQIHHRDSFYRHCIL